MLMTLNYTLLIPSLLKKTKDNLTNDLISFVLIKPRVL